MKNLLNQTFLLVGLLACFVRPAFGQDTTKNIGSVIIKDYAPGYPRRLSPQNIYTTYDVAPVPPGGAEGYIEFLKKNIKIPPNALESSGTVYLSIVVDSTGKLWDVHVEKDNVHHGCGEEAVRVVKMMPPWKPGMINGKPVNVRLLIPVKFVLH